MFVVASATANATRAPHVHDCAATSSVVGPNGRGIEPNTRSGFFFSLSTYAAARSVFRVWRRRNLVF